MITKNTTVNIINPIDRVLACGLKTKDASDQGVAVSGRASVVIPEIKVQQKMTQATVISRFRLSRLGFALSNTVHLKARIDLPLKLTVVFNVYYSL